jgi:hypothetical protein
LGDFAQKFASAPLSSAAVASKMPGVDDAQVEELRRWAKGLSTDPRPEVKAAAKAILLLSDDVLAARSQLLEERLIREALEAREAAEETGAADGAAAVPRDLLERVRSVLHRRAARLTG